jgi:hypothetical protein
MEVAITPKLATSKIVVTSIFNIYFETTNPSYGMGVRIYNLNTSGLVGLVAGRNGDGIMYSSGPWANGLGHLQYAIRVVDDLTYSTELRTYGLAIKNSSTSSSISLDPAWGTNTITATEIAQ